MRLSERNRGCERGKNRVPEPGEGCSLTSDDGFVTDCYITYTSENHFYCNEPPNLLPYLQRSFLLSFMIGFHFRPTTTDSWADWQQRQAAGANKDNREKRERQTTITQSWSEGESMCTACECLTERFSWPLFEKVSLILYVCVLASVFLQVGVLQASSSCLPLPLFFLLLHIASNKSLAVNLLQRPKWQGFYY